MALQKCALTLVEVGAGLANHLVDVGLPLRKVTTSFSREMHAALSVDDEIPDIARHPRLEWMSEIIDCKILRTGSSADNQDRGGPSHSAASAASSMTRSAAWRYQRSAYSPPRSSNSSCVPSSATRPSSSTAMRSASTTVDRRCAMTIVVR